MLLTRKAEFSASHVCANPAWSPERNQEVYGANANPNGHGHNYTVEVTVAGNPPAESGMVIDLKVLAEIIEQELIERVDHKNLNMDVDFMRGSIPTAENIALWIWEQLKPSLPDLCQIEVFETTDNCVIYRGV